MTELLVEQVIESRRLKEAIAQFCDSAGEAYQYRLNGYENDFESQLKNAKIIFLNSIKSIKSNIKESDIKDIFINSALSSISSDSGYHKPLFDWLISKLRTRIG